MTSQPTARHKDTQTHRQPASQTNRYRNRQLNRQTEKASVQVLTDEMEFMRRSSLFEKEDVNMNARLIISNVIGILF